MALLVPEPKLFWCLDLHQTYNVRRLLNLVFELFSSPTLSVPLSLHRSPHFSDKTDSFINILKGSLHLFEINEATLHLDLLLPGSVLYSYPRPLTFLRRTHFLSIKARVDGKYVFKAYFTSNEKRCFYAFKLGLVPLSSEGTCLVFQGVLERGCIKVRRGHSGSCGGRD